jgi:hypothetical protein
MLVRGAELWKNASNAAFLRFLAFCWPFAHMFFCVIP